MVEERGVRERRWSWEELRAACSEPRLALGLGGSEAWDRRARGCCRGAVVERRRRLADVPWQEEKAFSPGRRRLRVTTACVFISASISRAPTARIVCSGCRRYHAGLGQALRRRCIRLWHLLEVGKLTRRSVHATKKQTCEVSPESLRTSRFLKDDATVSLTATGKRMWVPDRLSEGKLT